MKRAMAVALLALFLIGAAAKPHKVVRDSSALEFSYEWPAEAAAIPALDLRFYKEAKAALRDAEEVAADDQEAARDQQRDFNGHYYSMDWVVTGQTQRLLALAGQRGTFEGGAHPNTSYDALLWDRRLAREIEVEDQFLRASSFTSLTRAAYCKALAKERRTRREGEELGGTFDECPKYSDLAIIPADKDKDGRLDTFSFIASPYVAGPYVEGEYATPLGVTRQLIQAMKPVYRGSYEPQRQ